MGLSKLSKYIDMNDEQRPIPSGINHQDMREKLKSFRLKQQKKEKTNPEEGFKLLYGYFLPSQQEIELKCYYMYNNQNAKFYFESYKVVKQFEFEDVIQYPIRC